MSLTRLVTIEVFCAPEILGKEIILATDHEEEYRGLFLFDKENQYVEKRAWISMELSEDQLQEYMTRMLQGVDLEEVNGRG
jgi:hypothetical protein